MNWKIYITDRAEKQIRKLPKLHVERIKNTIDAIEMNPFTGDIEKLGGEENVWRRIENFVLLGQKKIFSLP